MEAHAAHAVADAVHQYTGPVVVIVGGAAGDAVELVVVVVAQVGVVFAELVAIVFGCHVATAAPGFVADAEELHVPGLVATVLSAQTSHRRVAVAGHVFHPLGHLLHCATAHVAADVRLAAEHLAEIEELVGTEGVVLDGATPVVVAQRRTLAARTDAVHPVIVVGETAARPAQNRHFEGLQRLEHILAVAIDVGYGGILAHP